MFALASTGLMVSQGIGFVTAGAIGQFLRAGTTIAVFAASGLFTLALVRVPASRPGKRDTMTALINKAAHSHSTAAPDKAQATEETTMHQSLMTAIQDDAQRAGERDRLLLEAQRARVKDDQRKHRRSPRTGRRSAARLRPGIP